MSPFRPQAVAEEDKDEVVETDEFAKGKEVLASAKELLAEHGVEL